MDEVELTRRLAFGRLGIGASALATTKLFGLIFAGRAAADDPTLRIAARLFGVREIFIGLATLDALDRGQPARRLLQLGIMCDVSDAASIFIGRRALPWRGRLMGIGLAGLFTAAGLKASGIAEP